MEEKPESDGIEEEEDVVDIYDVLEKEMEEEIKEEIKEDNDFVSE
jgi:hypothetical protein